ncbi:MAG: DUF4294 domain-containing protein [Muribaculaceae bacterium]|nr:DUF4294 domain-containing protein [Muribaculaceae bacterium]
MIKYLLTILLLLIGSMSVDARKAQPESARIAAEDVPTIKRNPYRGYSWRVDEEGDTVMVIFLRDLTVYPPLKFKSKKDEEFYWQTVRDVKLTLPYAKLIAETLVETYEYIETFPTQKEREDYLKDMEKSLFNQYKPALRRFSKRQAKVLIKLIQRETHQSSYEIVRAFLGTFRASFWQSFGKLFGVSLKSNYNPKKDSSDATLDRIARCVEQGTL